MQKMTQEMKLLYSEKKSERKCIPQSGVRKIILFFFFFELILFFSAHLTLFSVTLYLDGPDIVLTK